MNQPRFFTAFRGTKLGYNVRLFSVRFGRPRLTLIGGETIRYAQKKKRRYVETPPDTLPDTLPVTPFFISTVFFN